jgi:hypothetical protein
MKTYYLVGSDVLTAVVMKSPILWHIMQFIPLKVNRRFGKTCRLHLQALLATCFRLVSCLTYSSTLKVGAIRSSETSVDFQRTIRRYIPEDRTLVHYPVQTSLPLNSTPKIPSSRRSCAIVLNVFYRKLKDHPFSTIADFFKFIKNYSARSKVRSAADKDFEFCFGHGRLSVIFCVDLWLIFQVFLSPELTVGHLCDKTAPGLEYAGTPLRYLTTLFNSNNISGQRVKKSLSKNLKFTKDLCTNETYFLT